MNRMTLAAFVSQHGQTEAARKLGTTQAAMSKAVRAGREIYVSLQPDGTYQAKEVRQFPSQERRTASA